MGSTVNTARIALNSRYAALRQQILEHYDRLALVGGAPAPRTQRGGCKRPPPKLGHWDAGSNGHSEHTLAAAPELAPVVRAIEVLLEQRDAARIKAQHTPRRRGDNFRPKNGPRAKVQTNPGEWPPIYK